jgi:serine/threonine protein kinase/tetratricopeptide (TPR) repeat protein
MGDRIGQQLGNYNLTRLLGQGGFAEVYLGEHLYLKTHAAIKVLHIHLGKEHEQDFLKEAQIIAHLDHPHIVRTLDFGVHEGTPFLVMQYALHGSMRTSHPRGTILPITTILPYLKEVASALQYAHDQKIIHRDIKPENILLEQNHHLFLSDFGLALVASSLSQLQNVVGTIAYMAPEQLQGHPCIASDQYALGVVTYEWLCGALPFSGSSPEVAIQHVMATPPPLAQRNPAISPAVEQVVMRALAKEPNQRFVHVTAFVTALEQAIALEHSEHHLHYTVPAVRHDEFYQRQSFVGRTQERAELRDLLRETERQRWTPTHEDYSSVKIPSFIPTRVSSAFLLGDAGIGKTRLAEVIGQEAQQCSWAVVQTRSYAQESHIPYQAWTEVLRSIIKQGFWQPQKESLSVVHCQTLAILVPEYSELLLQEKATIAETLGSEPLRIKEAICAVLSAISKHMPLLILLDDLHWADVSSIELFGYLVRRLVDFPVLLIGTGRLNELSSEHALSLLLSQLQRERFMTQFFLLPLTDAQIGELISHLPQTLVITIQQQAAGNPFFAEELARACLAQKRNGKNAHASSLAQRNLALPQTVMAVLDQYLTKLSRSCQQILGCAAVLGGSFSFALLSLLYTKGKTNRSEEEILSSLEEALAAKILLEEGAGNNITYRFRHPLLMNCLYENVSMTRRALLHRQAAEILRTAYTTHEAEGAALITHHLLHAGADAQMIADYAELAGNYAYTLAAYPEAELHYRLAIEQRKSQSERGQKTRQKQMVSTEEAHHQALLQEQLGECLRIQGRYADARHYYEQALEIWSQCTAAQETQQERQLLAILCVKIGQTWYDANNLEQAQQCYELSAQILQDGGIVTGTAMAYLRLQQSYIPWQQGSYESALHLAQEALELCEHALEQPGRERMGPAPLTQIRRTLMGDPVDLGRTHVLLAIIHTGLGQFNIALDHLNQALIIFEQYHCQREIAIMCCDIGDLYIRKADYAQAQSVLDRSLSLSKHVGDVPLTAFVLCNLGILQLRIGSLVTAETVLRQGIVLIGALNDITTIGLLHTCLASTLREQGEIDEASNMLHLALQTGRLERTGPSIGMILVALGQLRIDQALGISAEHDSRRIRVLMRARNTLQRALAMQALDAETSVEGHLALAKVTFLEGYREAAYQQALQVLNAARELELMWLVPSAQCLLGEISAALRQDEQADQYFIQAMDGFRAYGMRLAYGRALQCYGQFLQKHSVSDDKRNQQGQDCLQEACMIFRECNAKRDLQMLEKMLKNVLGSSTCQMVVKDLPEFSPVP